MYKGDFDLVTLKRIKLQAIPPNEEFVLLGDTIEEQLQRDETEYPNSVSIKKKRQIESLFGNIMRRKRKKKKKEESGGPWRSI